MERIDLDAAAGKVRQWMLEHPDGAPDQMTADLKGGYGEFADDMAVVLRGIMGRFQDHPEELGTAAPRSAARDIPGGAGEALETLRLGWGDAYVIGRTEDGRWVAVSRDGEGRGFAADSPGDLEVLLREDWAREGTL